MAFVLSQTCCLFNTSLALGYSSTGYFSIHVTFGGALTSIWHSFICWMLSQYTIVIVLLVRRRGKQEIVDVWLMKLILCLAHKPKDAKKKNIYLTLTQVYSSPSTPSILRALTIICWWQRMEVSLSLCGDWQAPHCLLLLVQACLETTPLRSAFSLTSLFPTRDSTSPSQV